jgi:transcriptional regulator with XRE-family HTH domain
MTQAEMARRIGVANVTQWKFEAGRLRPGLDRLRHIATLCSVTLDSLMPPEPAVAVTPRAQRRRKASA